MKKSTTFLLIVAFIISIFFISSMGVAAHNSHMKVYFTSIEILDCKTIKTEDGEIYYKKIPLESEGETVYQINYALNPDPSEVTEQDAFEFVFDSDGGTHIDIHGDEQPNAILTKNIVTFFAETTVMIRFQTTDGSNLSKQLMIICKAPKIV